MVLLSTYDYLNIQLFHIKKKLLSKVYCLLCNFQSLFCACISWLLTFLHFCDVVVVYPLSTSSFMSFLWILIHQVQITHLQKKIVTETYIQHHLHLKVHVSQEPVLLPSMIGIGQDGSDAYSFGFCCLQNFLWGSQFIFIVLSLIAYQKPLLSLEATSIQVYIRLRECLPSGTRLFTAPLTGDVESQRFVQGLRSPINLGNCDFFIICFSHLMD